MQAQTKEAVKLLSEKIPKKPDSRLQPKGRQLFQLNRIELNKAAAGQYKKVVTQNLNSEDCRRLGIEKRMAFVKKWYDSASSSESELIRSKRNIVWHVAALVCSLKEAGVHELVVYNSNNVPSIISEEAFNANAEETLKRVVDAAASDLNLREIEAWASRDGDWVVDENIALTRLALIFSLFDTLAGKFIEKAKRQQCLTKLKVAVSWITMEEIQMLAKNTQSSSSVNRRKNVFVLGMRRTGKSTMIWLLTGRGREDIGQETGSMNAKHDNTGGPITVWDTPGLCENSGYERINKRKLEAELRVHEIGAVILQVKDYRQRMKQEITLLQELNKLLGGQLQKNLMIAFRVNKEKNRESVEKHSAAWEEKLRESRVGSIGSENYICLDASIEKVRDGTAIRSNKREVDRVKRLLINKDTVVMDKSEDVRKAITKSKTVKRESWPTVVRDVLTTPDEYENTEGLRKELEGAYHIKAAYSKDRGHLRVEAQLEWPSGSSRRGPVKERVARVFSTGNRAVYYFESAASVKCKKFLEKMARSPPYGNEEEIKKWVNRLFDDSFKILQLENVPGYENRRFEMFENDLTLEQAIQIVSKSASPGSLRCVKKEGDNLGMS